MSDSLTGIKQILPTYPVKPARPIKERESGERQRKPDHEHPVRDQDSGPDDDERKSTIDEYI